MIGKLKALHALADQGVRTPTGRLVRSLSEAREVARDLGDTMCYMRRLDGSTAVKMPIRADQLVNWYEQSADSQGVYYVQRYLEFQHGGAVYVASEGISYCEVVAGLPMGLLQRGELGLAFLHVESVGDFTSSTRQADAWYMENGELAAREAPPDGDIDLRSIAGLATSEISGLCLRGLFEFGVFNQAVYWTDYKADRELGYLDGQQIRTMTVDRKVARCDGTCIPLPILAAPPDPSPRVVRYHRGSRLSHRVTYRYLQSRLTTQFCTW